MSLKCYAKSTSVIFQVHFAGLNILSTFIFNVSDHICHLSNL